MSVSDLPLVNAILNSIASCFLISGFIFIKKNNSKWHARMMISAFITSCLFLSSYLYYHFNIHMVTRYEGTGVLRPIYFFILFTHIPLAGLVAPLSIAAIWFAVRKKFETHKKITRWLFPMWLYVSVTGVVIYFMLYVL